MYDYVVTYILYASISTQQNSLHRIFTNLHEYNLQYRRYRITDNGTAQLGTETAKLNKVLQLH